MSESKFKSDVFPAATQFLPRHGGGDCGYYKCAYTPDIEYAVTDGHSLKLQLIVPTEYTAPLCVYIQGSGWAKQNPYLAIPMLSHLASRGFAVASVTFRDSSIAKFPAQLVDTKAAIRFLRKSADEFGFNADKIGAFGTSSGGHIACMLGVTGGLFREGENLQFSDNVDAVADFYGVTEFLTLDDFPGVMSHNAPDSPESLVIGGSLAENREAAIAASPVTYISNEKNIPPFLIVHGDSDSKVHFSQSAKLFEKLETCGKTAKLFAVTDGDHGQEGGTESPDTIGLVADFFGAYLR